jgi:Tfp pilus assembly protein PilF
MNKLACLLLSALLSACATAPSPLPNESFFKDSLFAAPSERIDANDVFALSPEMKNFLTGPIAVKLRSLGRQRGLVDALYTKTQLKLEFDSAMTRTAAQAFAARSGNCLSLVIMTATFAKELGLSVRFQKVYVDETWSRIGDNYVFIEHVNLTLSERIPEVGLGHLEANSTLIDFLPPQDVRGLRYRVLSEETILAMYMNNRAVELLTRGQFDDAYWFAREAIKQDPQFLSAYNTLGAAYRRHGDLAEAERAFSYVLARDPTNTRVMSNQVTVLNDLGRVAESRELTRRLEQLEPDPAFSFFKRGLAAMQDKDYRLANALFAKEVDRAPYYHEFHFWLALSYLGLGEFDKGREQLALAIQNSTTRNDHDLYAAKLDRLSSQIRSKSF